MDDGTTLATEATASQQSDAHRGFREDSVCPEWNVNQQTSHSWFRVPVPWTTALEMSESSDYVPKLL